jgi:uncharacterized metal-binding protein YceD (DUF177 family)
VEGKAPIGFFDLPEGGEVAEDQPLEFRLELLPDDDAVTVLGRLKASFSLECGRCLERFKLGVNLENWAHSAPVLKDETIDLTEQVREDILLVLPSYPRCEHGNIEPRVCPAEGRFETVDPVVNEGEDSGKPSVWDSLDQLN